MTDETNPAVIIAKIQTINREARDSLRRYLIDRAEMLRAARSMPMRTTGPIVGSDHEVREAFGTREAIETELASLERWITWLRGAV